MLAEYLRRADARPDWMVVAGAPTAPTGFFAAIPMTLDSANGAIDVAFTSFLTVAPDAGSVTLVLELYRDLLAALRRSGVRYVTTVFFEHLETTERVQQMFRLAGVPMTVLDRYSFGIRPILHTADGLDPVVPFAQEHKAGVAALLQRRQQHIGLHQRIQTSAISEHWGGALTRAGVVLDGDSVCASIVARRREVTRPSGPPNTVLHVDQIVIEPTDPATDAQRLRAAFDWLLQQEPEAESLVVPMRAHVPAASLLSAGCIKTPSSVSVAMGSLDGSPLPSPTSTHVEVF